MDFFTGLVIAGLIGKTIWEALRESPDERRIRERRERIAEQKRIRQLAVEEEKERKRHEAEEAARREKEGAFETSLECFSKQYVSYSRMATYNSCPHRFKLIYLDKESVIDYGYFDEGSAFHEVMRKRLWSSVGRVVTHLDYDSMAKMNRRYLDRRYVSWRVNARNRRNRLRFTCKTFPKNVEIVAVEKEL